MKSYTHLFAQTVVAALRRVDFAISGHNVIQAAPLPGAIQNPAVFAIEVWDLMQINLFEINLI